MSSINELEDFVVPHSTLGCWRTIIRSYIFLGMQLLPGNLLWKMSQVSQN
jgi:hypothetical protein